MFYKILNNCFCQSVRYPCFFFFQECYLPFEISSSFSNAWKMLRYIAPFYLSVLRTEPLEVRKNLISAGFRISFVENAMIPKVYKTKETNFYRKLE